MEKKHFVGATVILLLLAGVGWALLSGNEAELAEVKQMQSEMLSNIDNMSREEHKAARDDFRQRMEGLSHDQRREIGRGFRDFMMQRMSNLLEMPRQQQIVELDKLIDRMQERRQNRENGEGRGDRGGGNASSAERDQRRKERLDRTSPDQRAMMDQMKDLLNDRLEQRGMDPIEGGRPPFGPPPFGRPGGPQK